jgi:asparagine synthase (glutamine-hydrolysing)
MCGIGGIFRPEAGPGLKDAAGRLLGALLHRGPDDRGIFLSPDGRAALVHARLAILDPSTAGRQPMERSGHWITFNGELYNFRALRKELIRDGERFATETDTEVLLALYLRHGPACLARLRGMFAFAIWSERTCFLARDRFGIKPLYYGFSGRGELVFGSEVKALLATGMIERRLDPAGLESFLTSGSVTEPLTLLASVRSLEAGHWMLGRDGVWETRRYFQIDFQPVEETSQDAGERTRSALLDSVRHHFVSDVPVGIFLSGGLDSGALVALARETGNDDLATFSIGLEDLPEDESNAARQRANFFGTDHREMLLTRELASHWVGDFLAALDQPTVDGFNTYCVSKLARDHGYRVVLSGLGGDELFGGYPSFRHVPRLLQAGRALQPLHRVTTPLARVWERAAINGRSARMAAYLEGEATLPRAYQAVRSIFSPAERDKIGRSLLGAAWENSFPSEIVPELPVDPADGVSYLELTRYLRNQLLRDADVMSMAHGLELRVPFVDHELLAVLRTIPAAVRLAPGKKLLREAVPGLPEWRCKRGFTFPFNAWLDTTWRDLKEELRGAPAVPLDSWSRKWSLIVLSRWLRRHDFPGWPA